MKGEKSMNIVEMLLKNEIENETTSELNIKRLSEMCGCDIILKVKNIIIKLQNQLYEKSLFCIIQEETVDLLQKNNKNKEKTKGRGQENPLF